MPAALFALVTDGAAVDDGDVGALASRLEDFGTGGVVTRPGPGIVLGRRARGTPAGPGGGPAVVFDGRLDAGADPGPAVAAAVARAGARAFRHLSGDGAFVHADPVTGRVVASVDHVSSSPLFWACPAPGRVVIASDAAVLVGVWGTPGDLDEAYLIEDVANLCPDPEATEYRAVRRVPPGHALVVERGVPHLHRWWRYGAEPADWSAAGAAAALRDAVATAVERRLPAAGPVAVELSGGLDSSAIAACAGRSAQAAGRAVVAFTYAPAVGAGWDFFDELPFARAVVDSLDRPVEHRVLRSGEGPAHPDLPDRVVAAHPGLVPFTYRSLDGARAAGAGVLLSGWGGDHIVTDHAGPALPGLLRAGAWGPLWRDVRTGAGRARAAARFARIGYHAVRVTVGGPPVLPGERAGRREVDRFLTRCCLRPEVEARHGVRRRLEARDPSAVDLGHRQRAALESLLHRRMEGERLLAVTCGMEVRYPLLDRDLLELAATFPLELWHREGWGRWVFREAMRGVLPEPVRLRRDKLGGTSDSARVIARNRERLIDRAEAVRGRTAVTGVIDVDSMLAQLRALPTEEELRVLPGHGADHPALHRRGALLRSLAAAERLARVSSRPTGQPDASG